MMRRLRTVGKKFYAVGGILWLLVLTAPFSVFATHQVGGQLEMHYLGDRPGHFRITVTNYLEAGIRADQQTGGPLGIFRKRDNVQMMTFRVSETGQRQPVIYANEFCARQRNLKFIAVTFESDIQLDPALYADPQGYYISYQTRNRNAGINNISSPAQTGYTFYLEFPALLQNSRLFENSSPHFGPINGEYICVGEPFTFPFGGTDPDGDDLRYSMVTPLNLKGNGQNGVSAGPYPDVGWLPGFSAANAMTGQPTLTVDEQTGRLSVTATELGLYVFAVKVEEYRNGQKIGEVRRDFQFLVVDCPPATTPDPAVQINNRPGLRQATICYNQVALLQATVNPGWNYQWRRDGVNLAGATDASLAVREAGEYTVIVSTKETCNKVGNSQSLTISVVGNEAKLSASGHLCATTGSVSLTTAPQTDILFQWFRDGQALAGQTGNVLNTTQPGRFWATLTHRTLGCVSRTDSVSIERSAAVQAVIQSATGQNRLCPQGTLSLTGSGGTQYSWQRNGQPLPTATTNQYDATATGSYVLTATDGYGCTGVSLPFLLTPVPPVTVQFDSIPPFCGSLAAAYTLQGSPAGGVFAGAGVAGRAFSPEEAGVGNHTLTYTVKPAPECDGVIARRTAVVAPIPTISLADSMTTFRGNTFTLRPEFTGDPNRFRWTAATYLDNPDAVNPTVTNIQNDITYTLTVQNSAGCRASDTIRITVFARLWLPDAFTPNGDGLNDVWQLPGIEAFPDAVVTIFNRWGEVIFQSDKGYHTPFNGWLQGAALPAGVYAYTVHTVPEQPVIRGKLTLIR